MQEDGNGGRLRARSMRERSLAGCWDSGGGEQRRVPCQGGAGADTAQHIPLLCSLHTMPPSQLCSFAVAAAATGCTVPVKGGSLLTSWSVPRPLPVDVEAT